MRKDRKYIWEIFSFYDHTGIEKHLEKMAGKGWLLSNIHSNRWEYRRIEPAKLHFAVSYFPKASEFDPEPLEGQMIYREFGEKSGWKFICSFAQMQIFYNEEETPIPLETDPVVEVDVIHKAAKRNFLPTHFILFALSILQAGLSISSLLGDPIRLLSSTTQLATGFCWAWLFLFCFVELAGYYRWHHRAVRAAENGDFLDTPNHVPFQKLALAAATAALVYIFISLVSSGDSRYLVLYLLCIACAIIITVTVNVTMNLMKRAKASRTVNFTTTIIVDIVLAIVLMSAITWGIFSSVRKGIFTDTVSDSKTEIVYQAEAPLVVEDLLDVSFDGYTKENRQSESIFLGQRALWQWPKLDGNEHIDAPALRYTVTIVKVPAIYNFCKNSMVNKPNDRLDDEGNLFINHYEAVDASPWQANEAYQLHWSEGILFKYILCYEDRIIEIGFDWEPTADQMRIVAEKLARSE